MSPMLKLTADGHPGVRPSEIALAEVTETWPARPSPRPEDACALATEEEIVGWLRQPPFADSARATFERRAGTRKLLAWLASYPGQTWQQRWLASGADEQPDDWMDTAAAWLASHWNGSAHQHKRQLPRAVKVVVGGGAVRPSYRWLMRHANSKSVWRAARAVQDPGGFATLEAYCRPDATITDTMRQYTVRRLTWIVIAKGGTLTDITVGDLIEVIDAERAWFPGKAYATALTYRVLRELKIFPPDAPVTLRATRTPGPRSVTELVGHYRLSCQPMRELLIDYIAERTQGGDYATRRHLVTTLAGNFWADLERHHPGIDSLELSREVAEAWKQRLRHVRDRDGNIVRDRVGRHEILIDVRALYLDLAQWAAEDPSRWGPWVARCPISAAEANTRKHVAHRKARMDQRTRERLPVLPTLIRVAEDRKHASKRLLDAALATEPGELFTCDGQRFRRHQRRDTLRSTRIWATDLAIGQRRDLGTEEQHGFWAWAAIEVLRHTGVRLEELLELTHHNFVSYTVPGTGEIVPLLQITPSKLDKERMLVVTPELGEVLTAIIHRVRGGEPTLPQVSAYHTADEVWSPPMPFLFQRPHGHERRAISSMTLRTLLDQTLKATGLTDAQGQPLRFVPHDFRRIFITDAILHGLPPHIAQVIAGHANINTTIGYKAAYPIEAINAFRGFLARRRQTRPIAEYRPVSTEEWDKFIGHFAKRKLSLGDCAREYDSPCQHEHACIRCPLLRPDPDQRQRLLDIRANLVERIEEARDNSWIGEVDGLEATLAAADHKLAEMDALSRHPRTVHLGLPAIPTGATP